MSDFVHIEPADEQRRAFARWALAQTPKLQTSSSTGTDVPLDLYPEVPPELLEGAFVDGFRYGGQDVPQPPAVTAPKAPAAPASTGAAKGTQATAGGPEKKPRKRAPRRPRKATRSSGQLTAEQLAAEITDGITPPDSGGQDSAGE